MPHRPRNLAAFLIIAAVLSGCALDVRYEDSHYACDSNGECPIGYTCEADFCERVEPGDVDAGGVDAGADATPFSLDADLPDATPAPIDATPAPDASIPCTAASGQKVILDPTTDHCYIRVSLAMTWSQAKSNCETLGGGAHLVTIASAQEQLAVALLDDGTISRAWIGATDSAGEGDWRWIDGKDFPPSPSPNALSLQKWRTGEPNNTDANDPTGEDCGTIELTNNGLWDDRSCAGTRASICERD